MENIKSRDLKTPGIVLIALFISFIGGILVEEYNLQPKIDELKLNNTELETSLSNLKNIQTAIQNTLSMREIELSTAQEEIKALRENLDVYASNIETLQEEVTRATELYQQLDNDYHILSTEYDNLSSQTQYILNKIFLAEDFYRFYNPPTRTYTSPDFTAEGATTRFDYIIYSEKDLLNPSADIRIFKAGTSLTVYSYAIKLKEFSSGLFTAEGSFSVVLDEGKYYFDLIIRDGSLSLAPIYQSNIHIWNYYKST